ncbi:MAG: hypothetical protein K6E90_00655 [Lachnospiraceae bacterium]|nr:hypothetical protein [Lachnospiraceae bacterium]
MNNIINNVDTTPTEAGASVATLNGDTLFGATVVITAITLLIREIMNGGYELHLEKGDFKASLKKPEEHTPEQTTK